MVITKAPTSPPWSAESAIAKAVISEGKSLLDSAGLDDGEDTGRFPVLLVISYVLAMAVIGLYLIL